MTDKSNVTPWEVEGKVDYERLMKEFGVEEINQKLLEEIEKISEQKGEDLHIFLKRGLFFAHRDFDKALKEYKKGNPFFLYTGRSPGGEMHIGHLISFQFTKYLQDIFDVNLYIQIPDDEKFLFKRELTQEKIEEMTKTDLENISAMGFDPDKTFIFRNTEYIRNMYPMYLKTAKKILLSQAKATFGFDNSSNLGMINYPAIQIVPTFFEESPCVIPCAIDQDPYFRLQRDFAEQLGYYKNANIHSKFLTPLTGPEGKMSASDSEKSILLTETPETVKKKVNKHAFSGGQATKEEHQKYGGNTEIDVAYQWLYFLFEKDNEKIQQIKEDYENGKLLSGDLKKLLIEKITEYLKEFQQKKEEAKKNNLLDKYMYSGKLAKKMWEKTHQ